MMADSQHFCLRWNNYQSSITSAFENLRDDEDFVDVTLACDGKSLKAHRVVLSACSPYFRELLKSTPCKHPVIVLQDVAFIDLHSLVEFIYHGEVNVHQRNLSSFLKTAEVLRVSGLTQQAEDKEEGMIPQQRPSSRSNPLHNSFTEKLMESALFPSTHPHPHPLPHSSPTPSPLMSSGGATINQLLRRAAAIANNRRERQPSPEHQEHSDSSDQSQHSAGKRARTDQHTPPNNLNLTVNNEAQDFTTSNFVAKNNSIPKKSDDRLDRSPSPINNGESVKPEPMDLLMGTTDLDNSNDSMEASGDLTSHQSTRDHDEQDSIHGHHPTASNYLTAQESKLFGSSGGTFNFSMAALAGDPTGLAGLNQNLQGNSDGTAGSSSQDTMGIGFLNGSQTSQNSRFAVNIPQNAPQPFGAAPSSPFCPVCCKTFTRAWSLQRHMADTHFYVPQSFLCEVCHRSYRSRNSLVSHKSQYHGGNKSLSSGTDVVNNFTLEDELNE